jgi:CRISPR/Cas system endoribonuclease Cas6 (RAMP superfamily)
VFRLLYERLLMLDGLHLPFAPEVATLETFAQYYVEMADYDLNCVEVMMKRPTKAFCGAVTYHVLETNDAFEKRARTRRDQHGDGSLIAAWEDIHRNHGQYGRLVNLLAHFAFYSGVGSKTGQGMGMVRPIEAC